MSQLRLDEGLFRNSLSTGGDIPTMAGFARGLKGALRGADPEPFPGLSLEASLELIMKIARHTVDAVPAAESTLQNVADRFDAQAVLTPVIQLCESTIALGVSMRTQGAPSWLFRWLHAGRVFRMASWTAEMADEPQRALHWAIAQLLLPSTCLGFDPLPPDRLNGGDIERISQLQNRVDPGSTADEIDTLQDLFRSYRLFL